MFGVLLESRARRQRRSGGMALSGATHLAIVGAITVTTTATTTQPAPIQPLIVRIVPPTEPKPAPRNPTPRRNTSPAPGRPILTIDVKQIQAPTIVPVDLPPIELKTGASLDSLIAIAGNSGDHRGPSGLGRLDLEEKPSSGPWSSAELMMRLVSSGKPRYPETLRQSGIDGRVLVRFTVDTLGRIDPSSVAVVQSTHELFARAVRDALTAFRFRPAEVGGKRVPALAEMPFEFAITR